jgi:hypothetical protein
MSKESLKIAIAKAKELLFQDPEVKAKWDDLTHISGWADFFRTFGLTFWFAQRLAFAVEQVQKEYGLCTEEERIAVASETLDDLIEFKGWMAIVEPFDDKLFKVIISAAVAALNGRFGNGAWYQWIAAEAITLVFKK